MTTDAERLEQCRGAWASYQHFKYDPDEHAEDWLEEFLDNADFLIEQAEKLEASEQRVERLEGALALAWKFTNGLPCYCHNVTKEGNVCTRCWTLKALADTDEGERTGTTEGGE